MATEWNKARIEQLIRDATQESLTLEYKAAASLARDDKKKTEITKDVGAMANSAGGTIIYGVKEYDDKAKEHLPEKLDPVDLRQFSKEWLEQVIMNIRPRINALTIHPVTLDTIPHGVAYVVEIPQSTTAHQSSDHRYYRRFNFMSVPMEDYEIRDIMARNQHPKVELEFGIACIRNGVFFMRTYAINRGSVYGQYVVVQIEAPYDLFPPQADEVTGKINPRIFNLDERYSYNENNYTGTGGNSPILPNTKLRLSEKRLNDFFEDFIWEQRRIEWVVMCDNAQPNSGETLIADIPIIYHRQKSGEDCEEAAVDSEL